MTTRELRIGNYVEIYQGNKVGFVDNCIVESIYGYEVNGYSDDDIHPIPITQKWLFKFGFIWHNQEYYNGVIYIKNAHISSSFPWGLYPEELGSGMIIKNHKKLQYVHQLQNLYFAITGEELVISQPSEK